MDICVAPANMDILAEFPQPVTVLMGSSTETGTFSNNAAPNGVPDTHTGYREMMEYCGQASTAPSSGDQGSADPFPTRFRPIKNFKKIKGRELLLLESITFYAYDNVRTGAAGQDTDNITAIEGSLATQNDAWMQSRFLNGLLGNWNPNYFSPVVRVNGVSIMDHTQTDVSDNHLGHLSIGPPLPFTEEYRLLCKGVMDNIEINAQLIQEIRDTAGVNFFQRYFLLAAMRWRYKP